VCWATSALIAPEANSLRTLTLLNVHERMCEVVEGWKALKAPLDAPGGKNEIVTVPRQFAREIGADAAGGAGDEGCAIGHRASTLHTLW
jgi:hypothetical protein